MRDECPIQRHGWRMSADERSDVGESSEPGNSAQRRITHAETGAHMFGEQLDGRAIGDRIGLRQIFHGFDQSLLSVNVTWIAGPFSFPATDIGHHWNGKNFGHEKFTLRLIELQYICPLGNFQP